MFPKKMITKTIITIEVAMGVCSNCHMHENNQDKNTSKGHEHIMTKKT